MAAQTASRTAPQTGDGPLVTLLSVPVKAATKIFAGSLVVADAGYAAPGRTATALFALGVARKDVDNSAGAAGDQLADIERGAFPFNNSASTDAITQASLYQDVYIVDDNTVAKTDGSGTRSKAGRAIGFLDNGQVVVEVGGR